MNLKQNKQRMINKNDAMKRLISSLSALSSTKGVIVEVASSSASYFSGYTQTTTLFYPALFTNSSFLTAKKDVIKKMIARLRQGA